jgi:hypothetical protein
MRGRRVVAYLGAGLLGLPPAFFLVLAALFGDGTAADYPLVFLLVASVYAVLGGVVGFAAWSWRAGPILPAGAAMAVLAYAVREPGVLPLGVGPLAAVLGAASLGATARAALRRRRTSLP